MFFTNSGTEANEAAFKLTRRTGRTQVVVAEGSFHGRTMGALALTSKEAYRAPFEPLPGDVTFVPYGDADALAAAVTDETAAILLEPIQGEAGVVVPPEGYLAAARAVADEHGALLWLDEVQSGMGRTGALVRPPRLGVRPDIVTVAKGLGGGFPIGACIGLGAAGDLLQPGNHGTTFGGNPVACAAALAVIRTIEDEDLLEHVTVLGQKLRDGLAADPRVTEVRGEGLLIGLDLSAEASADVAAAARERRVHRQQPDPDPDPAGAAAGAHRGRRRRVPRRLAGHPRRRDGSGRSEALPRRRRPDAPPSRRGSSTSPSSSSRRRTTRSRSPARARWR